MKSKIIWVLTLFPEYFEAFQEHGVIGKALQGERDESVSLKLQVVNIRDYADDRYKSVDSYPYGGGAGMVMKPDVLARAMKEGIGYEPGKFHVVFPSPRGKTWSNESAKAFAKNHFGSLSHDKDIVFICGRYEGVDERFLENYVDEYISVGNFILSGGELASMLIVDSSLRFVDGILGNKNSSKSESFQEGLLEYPLYTKPRTFEGKDVPSVLLSGHHKKIEEFKKEQSLAMTKKYRSDLWEDYHE